MRTVAVTRYVTPLREGGSLPALVEADDDGLYVLKFRAAGHGTRALVAELIAGELARVLGLPVPEIVFASLDRELSRTEPDPEIHQLMHDSAGLNLGVDFLPGSLAFDPIAHTIDAALASSIVWFDALIANVDRTARNTNMLWWHRKPWIIDHGSSLYFHHTPGWERQPHRATDSFPAVREHVLLRSATQLEARDEPMAALLRPEDIDRVLSLVPEAWLTADGASADAATLRAAYRRYFVERLEPPRRFAEEAIRAR
ncbi:MAG: HipA family kinase [Vicinamibacterales bacterium]